MIFYLIIFKWCPFWGDPDWTHFRRIAIKSRIVVTILILFICKWNRNENSDNHTEIILGWFGSSSPIDRYPSWVVYWVKKLMKNLGPLVWEMVYGYPLFTSRPATRRLNKTDPWGALRWQAGLWPYLRPNLLSKTKHMVDVSFS